MEFVGIWVLFAILSVYIAGQKGRSRMEGFVLGLFFGPVGAIIEALLPTLDALAPARARAEAQGLVQRMEDEAAERREAGRQSRMRQEQRRHETRQARARERLARRRERDEHYRDRGIKPGPWAWYQALPDWLQPILLGAAIALPLGLALAIGLGWR